jgi:hypothetical protein
LTLQKLYAYSTQIKLSLSVLPATYPSIPQQFTHLYSPHITTHLHRLPNLHYHPALFFPELCYQFTLAQGPTFYLSFVVLATP